MTEPEIITVTDIRKAGHCASGIRAWFDAQGLDFRDFLKNGITVEKLLESGDGQAERVVRVTRERAKNRG